MALNQDVFSFEETSIRSLQLYDIKTHEMFYILCVRARAYVCVCRKFINIISNLS